MPMIRRYSNEEFLTVLLDTNSGGRLVPELPAELSNSQWAVDSNGDGFASFELIPETIVFTTSGSTGKPKNVRKSRDQIAREAEAVLGVVSHGTSRPDEVISFAPPNHAFGFLCGFALSLRLGVPFTYNPINAGIPPAGVGINSSLVLALPASFRALEKSEDAFTSRSRTAILQSAGPASPRYAATIEALRTKSVEGFEIYGSTEAGAIAHRRTDVAPNAWTLFNDIELLPSGDVSGVTSEMIVSGPRCAFESQEGNVDILRSNQSLSVRTGDIARFTGQRQFALVGRLDRVIQINGVNTDLDVLQQQLTHYFQDVDFYVEKKTDDLRGHGFVVHFFCGGTGGHVERIKQEVAYIVSEAYPKSIYPSKIELSREPFRRSPSGKVLGLPRSQFSGARIDVL
ncbi:AMP-binding protein [Agrobacterium vitis]|uniref:AMP-binding protein n=1 Tax=Agrobacterium vitis TaxID=373 RepID=UPI001F3928A8|nr:class I adenylate-forming enzyme family protein [Agrobacterium vitis]MCE6076398.1 AMP-binding protein [Agrobacterium vitis]